MRRGTPLGVYEINSFSYLPWPYFGVTMTSGCAACDPTAARKTAAAVSSASSSAAAAAATGKTIRENRTPGRRENRFHEIKPQPFRRTYTIDMKITRMAAIDSKTKKQNDGDANITREILPDPRATL